MDAIPALSDLPKPSTRRIALHVAAPAERAIRQGQPWVFDQSIIEQSHSGVPGDLAVIFDSRRRFLAIGCTIPLHRSACAFCKKGSPRRLTRIGFRKK